MRPAPSLCRARVETERRVTAAAAVRASFGSLAGCLFDVPPELSPEKLTDKRAPDLRRVPNAAVFLTGPLCTSRATGQTVLLELFSPDDDRPRRDRKTAPRRSESTPRCCDPFRRSPPSWTTATLESDASRASATSANSRATPRCTAANSPVSSRVSTGDSRASEESFPVWAPAQTKAAKADRTKRSTAGAKQSRREGLGSRAHGRAIRRARDERRRERERECDMIIDETPTCARPVYLLLLQSQRREGRRGNLHARLLGDLHHAGFPGLPLLLLGAVLNRAPCSPLRPPPFLWRSVFSTRWPSCPPCRPPRDRSERVRRELAAPLLTLALLASLLLALRESHLIVELERELGERILLVRNLPLEVLVVGRGAELLRQRRDVRLERSLLVRLPAPDAAAGERRVLLAVVAASLLERQFAGPGAAEEGRRTAARAGVVGAGPFATLLEVEPRPSIAAVARRDRPAGRDRGRPSCPSGRQPRPRVDRAAQRAPRARRARRGAAVRIGCEALFPVALLFLRSVLGCGGEARCGYEGRPSRARVTGSGCGCSFGEARCGYEGRPSRARATGTCPGPSPLRLRLSLGGGGWRPRDRDRLKRLRSP